jgi:ribosome-binding factor A
MNRFRQDRINEAARQVLGEALRSVKDPRVATALVTITGVRVSKDMKFAKVFFNCMDADAKEVKTGLYSAQGFLRSCLAKNLDLRITPELTFEYDDSAENGARIEAILKGLQIKPDEEETNE